MLQIPMRTHRLPHCRYRRCREVGAELLCLLLLHQHQRIIAELPHHKIPKVKHSKTLLEQFFNRSCTLIYCCMPCCREGTLLTLNGCPSTNSNLVAAN